MNIKKMDDKNVDIVSDFEVEQLKHQQKIGIIGGGQLGKMMTLEAKKMGFYVSILDPTPDCPAHSLVDNHIVGDFNDEAAIRSLAEKSDIITYELEHINVNALQKMEMEGYKIYPTGKSLKIIQNKYKQKKVLTKNNIPVPDFLKVENINDIEKFGEKLGYPLMLKSCLGGYDGRGNKVIKNKQNIAKAYQSLGSGKKPLMVEEYIPFSKEISVLACRGIRGNILVYPVGENDHQDNILFETFVPANISSDLTEKAMSLAHKVLEIFEGIGMFCVEMFVTKDIDLMINEIAPRPHNSGHYTIEGCVTSQFEQHIRAITGLTLGETTLLKPTVMRNILGEENSGKYKVSGLNEIMKIKGLTIHIYDKKINRPNRKMGHLTVIDSNLETARKKALEASNLIKIDGQTE